MKIKLKFMFILLLVLPLIVNQILAENIIDRLNFNSNYSVDINRKDGIDTKKLVVGTNDGKNFRKKENTAIISLNEDKTNPYPKFSYGLYNTFSQISSVPEFINKGENVSVTSSTKFDLGTLYPVDKGTIYWYDLNCIEEDLGIGTSFVESSKLAVSFTLDSPANYMAVYFDISNLADLSGDIINVYLTSDLNNYSIDYMAKSELSFRYYNSQSGVSGFYAFYDNPTTTQIDNSLLVGTTYFIVLEGDNSLRIETSLDSEEYDDNQVYVFSEGSWGLEQGIDAKIRLFSGLKLTEKTISSSSNGETTITYQSSQSNFKYHTLAAFYYDDSGMYDLSCASSDFRIIDENIPEYLLLESPTNAEYTDYIELKAYVKNYYYQELENQTIYFYYSEDNSSWIEIGSSISDSTGIAKINFLISKASGYYYFKAVTQELEAFNYTETEKEQVIIETPLVQTIYGNQSDSDKLETFSLKIQVHDNDNTPISGVMVFFYVEGKIFVYDITDENGYAKTHSYSVNWDVGYYNNKYWINIDLDSDLYLYPDTQYGDIEVLKSSLQIHSTDNNTVNVWINDTYFSFEVKDPENDSVTNIEFESLLYDPFFDEYISLGYAFTNDTGYGQVTIPAYFKEPGKYTLIVRISDSNYYFIEENLQFELYASFSILDCNLPSSIEYVYNSSLILEGNVSDTKGNPIVNANITVLITDPSVSDNWIIYLYTTETNSQGHFSLNLTLDVEVDQELVITIQVENYYGSNNEISYYETYSQESNLLCIRRDAEILHVQDLTTQNQETITISGLLIDSGVNLAEKEIKITILEENYFVFTNAEGWFYFDYQVNFGTNVTFTVAFESDNHYNNINLTRTIISSPISLNVEIEDFTCNPNSLIYLSSYVYSDLGTNPANVRVEFYLYDEQWILLGIGFTNETGIATLNITSPDKVGEFSWKVIVAQTDDWIESSSNVKLFQIGYHTSVSMEAPTQEQYGNEIRINFTVVDQFGQPIEVELKFYIDGLLLSQISTDANGFGSFYWTIDLNSGNYYFKAVVLNQTNYISSSCTQEFEIIKADLYIQSSDLVMTCNETRTMEFYVYSINGGVPNLQLNILLSNGYSSFLFTNSSGYAIWTIPILPSEVYTVNVTFNEDSRYKGVSVNYSLIVNKIETNVILLADDSYYLETYEICGYIENSRGQGIESITVNLFINETFTLSTTTLSDGAYSFVILLLPNYYNIEVQIEGNNYINPSSRSTSVYIYKLSSTLTGNIEFINDTMVITANLSSSSEPVEGQIIYFYVNNSLVGTNFTNEYGQARIEILNVTPSLYSVNIGYKGNEIYQESSLNIQAEKDKEQTEIKVYVEEGVYSQFSTNMFVSLTSNGESISNQYIKLNFDNNSYLALTNSTGVAVIVIDINYLPGNYIGEIIYEGNEIYSTNAVSVNINIYKSNCVFSSLNIEYYDTLAFLKGKIEGTYPLEDEIIHIKINGSSYDILQTDENGAFSTILTLDPGEYILSAIFNGNEYFLPANKSIYFSISKITSELEISNFSTTIEYGKGELVELKLYSYNNDSGIEGQVSITLNGSLIIIAETNIEGVGSFVIPDDLEVGTYILQVSYAGDKLYYSTFKSIAIKVKYKPEILITDSDLINYGIGASICGTLTLPLEGISIELRINNLNYSDKVLTNDKGEFVFDIPSDFPCGNMTIELLIENTETIIETIYSFESSRGYGEYSIIVSNLEFSTNSTENIIGKISFKGEYNSSGKVYIKINDTIFSILEFGELGEFDISHSVFDFLPGEYEIAFYFEFNNENFKNQEIVKTIRILKLELNLEIITSNSEIYVFEIFTLNISTDYPIEKDRIKLFINNTEYLFDNFEIVEDHNYFSISFVMELTGNVNITVIVEENDLFYSSEQSLFIQVLKRNISFQYNQDAFYYNSSIPLIVEIIPFKNETDLEFSVIVGEKNQTGVKIINFMLKNFYVGEYQVNVQFKGNEYYNTFNASFTICIIPQPTKIVYKENKTEYLLTLLLLDSENRSISNVETTIFFLDVMHHILENRTLLTDDKGYLHLDVSTFPEGTTMIRVVFNGDVIYEDTMIDIEVEDIVRTYTENVKIPKMNMIHMLISIPVSVIGLIIYSKKDIFKYLRKN
ncbi:MAG: carboxypeptidase-like regulatory domain-containing protein [Candidatus Heimdallarchaeaceae archaeon]